MNAAQALTWFAWGFFMGMGWSLGSWLISLATRRFP